MHLPMLASVMIHFDVKRRLDVSSSLTGLEHLFGQQKVFVSSPRKVHHFLVLSLHASQSQQPTAVRSISVDSITNKTSLKRIIVTEPITLPSARANTVDIDSVTVEFDRPSTPIRAYIPSPWANSSTSAPVTITTTIQFTKNNKIHHV